MFYFYKEEPQFAMEHFLPFQQQPQRRRTCRRSQLMPSGQPMIIRRVPHQIDVFEHLMNEAEKKVCSEQRHFESVRDYWEAIETVAKAMMNAMEKEETEKPVEEKKSDNKENAPEEQPAAKENIKQAEETPIITKAPEDKPVAKKEVVKRFGSKVNVNENMEKVEIVIELIGHKFEGEHLDVAVIDGNVMSVKAEDGDKKFERKFKLPQNANIDKIESKFSSKDEDKQIMTITIPKEVRITQIPIAMEE